MESFDKILKKVKKESEDNRRMNYIQDKIESIEESLRLINLRQMKGTDDYGYFKLYLDTGYGYKEVTITDLDYELDEAGQSNDFKGEIQIQLEEIRQDGLYFAKKYVSF